MANDHLLSSLCPPLSALRYLPSVICYPPSAIRHMPYAIVSTCTACGACLPVCPIDAISVGDPIYVIDRELCCDFEDCLAVCPVDAIAPVDESENHDPSVRGPRGD